MGQIIEAVRSAYGDYRMIALYGICLIIGLILFKRIRKPVFVPAMIITITVFTPPFFRIWEKLNEAMVYWRALWMVPVIPVCACIVATAVLKSKRVWLKASAVVLCLLVFAFCGRYVYKHAYPPNAFTATTKAEKLPDDVVDVGEVLLELEDYPRVVADSSLSIYLRQFSGRIRSPYGRSVTYGSPSAAGKEMYGLLTDGDYPSLARMMSNYDYDLLVTINDEEKKVNLENAGFEALRQVNSYGIYRVHCPKTEQRTYDDYGRVISVTQVDEEGAPVNSDRGYATVLYEYDDHGFVSYEFHLDDNGNGVPDSAGKAGYRCKYNHLGHIVEETNLDGAGNPVVVKYATRTCEYNSNHLIIREAYFDEAGNPMLRTDDLYASRTFSYAAGTVTVASEHYFGLNGEPVLNLTGFASYTRDVDKNGRIVRESYWGVNGEAILCVNGCAEVRREYDEAGNMVMECYFNPDGSEAMLDVGYSRVIRQFNENNRLIREDYFADGRPVLRTDTGIAGFACEYDAQDRLVRESYFGAEHESVNNNKGYAEYRNEYTNEGILSLTYYYDVEGNLLQRGSSYLHEYLLGCNKEGVTVFIAAKDEASRSFTVTLVEDMKALGIESDIQDKYRYSFCAVVNNGTSGGQEAMSPTEVHFDGTVDGKAYSILSAGYDMGNISSIIIDGVEYSKNVRGLNIVIYKDGKVVDTVGFDTHMQEMDVTR